MREIIITQKASIKLDSILDYLQTEWSEKVKTDFISKLEKTFEQIQKYPNSYKKSQKIKGLHLVIVSKQISYFYRFDKKTITIITFFDNRMNPKNLNIK